LTIVYTIRKLFFCLQMTQTMDRIRETVYEIMRLKFPAQTGTAELRPDALLSDDLGLNSVDIVTLGLYIENYYQKKIGQFWLKDHTITSWRTIYDIMKSVKEQLTC